MKKKARVGLVWLLALSLFISVSASAIAVASRIRYYTFIEDVESMIPLVPESVTLDELRAAAAAKAGKTFTPQTLAADAPVQPFRFSAINVTYCAPEEETYFTVSDDNTVWGTNTRVEIFKTEYENGSANITVASSNGDKVIAPGTENSYTFKLKNTHTVAMDYTVTVNAYCTPAEIELPVVCRLSRSDDAKWISGDESSWETVEEFDGASDAAILSGESYVTYTLDWQWPFEGDDGYDTMLGNLAAEQDLTLTIEINTSAEADFDPPGGGGGGGGTDPDDPDVPIDPDDPDVPVDPDDPDVPVDPDDPDVPVDPDHPDPVIPGPDTPDSPEIGKDLPPKTGDESNPVLWIALAAVSFVLLVILMFSKDKDEKISYAEARKREKTY